MMRGKARGERIGSKKGAMGCNPGVTYPGPKKDVTRSNIALSSNIFLIVDRNSAPVK
jgi:hypothetical protein